MVTVKKLGVCLLAFLVLFGFAWVLDPNSAMLHQASTIRRGAMYFAYVGSIWVSWLTYQPKE